MTLKVFMMRSGYSSRTLLMSRVPMPDPVAAVGARGWGQMMSKIVAKAFRRLLGCGRFGKVKTWL
jgi:hypothetical protein